MAGSRGSRVSKNETKLKLDIARIEYWVSKGAQQSDRVKNLVTTFRKANA